MKKVVAITVGLIATIVIGTIIFWPNKKISKIIVIPRKYHYIVDQSVKIDVPIFLTNPKDIDKFADAYGFLEDDNKPVTIFIEDITISESHQETFEEQLYFGFNLSFYLGAISGEVNLENSYLRLYYGENLLRVYLGQIYLSSDQSNDNLIRLIALSGSKDEKMHLNQIHITTADDVSLNEVFVGNTKVNFYVHGNQIVINLKSEPFYYNNPFIVLCFNQSCQYIYQFDYFIHYQMLKTSVFYSYLL